MRSVSQTLIGVLREEIAEYRRINRLSRETVAASIVETHEAMGADASTGIRFEPKTTDTFERTKVNADRIFRWLDDDSKDNNLLPANFLLSILAGVPAGVRRRVLSRLLMPLGFSVQALDAGRPDAPAVSASAAANLIREQSEAAAAVTGLLGGQHQPDLADVHREITEALDAGRLILARVEAQMNRRSA